MSWNVLECLGMRRRMGMSSSMQLGMSWIFFVYVCIRTYIYIRVTSHNLGINMLCFRHAALGFAPSSAHFLCHASLGLAPSSAQSFFWNASLGLASSTGWSLYQRLGRKNNMLEPTNVYTYICTFLCICIYM